MGHGHEATLFQVHQYLAEQTRTNMYTMVYKHCEVGKISRHYSVGHGSVPCRPLHTPDLPRLLLPILLCE